MNGQVASEFKIRRLPILNMYQRLHFKERIKAAYDVDWAEEEQKREALIAAGKTVPNEIGAKNTTRDKAAARVWLEESEEFRQSVVDAVEEDLEQQREEKRLMEEDPETPDQHDAYVTSN